MAANVNKTSNTAAIQPNNSGLLFGNSATLWYLKQPWGNETASGMDYETPWEMYNESYALLNLTNDSSRQLDSNVTGYVPYHLRPETYIVPILFALIFIVGVIGNGTLIIIFVRNKTLRNIPNTYIISLALGDLLVLFFTVPFVSTIYTIESWPYGTFECKFSEFVKDISVGVTVFTLTVLSADRYLAIVAPVKKVILAGRRVTLRAAIGIWVLALLLATPAAVFTNVRPFPVSSEKTISVCYPFPKDIPEWYMRANILTKALIYYVLPLIVIATFYLLMARSLLASDVPGEINIFQKQLRTRRKVAKVVLCFVLIFAVCFLPNHVFLLWFYFHPYALAQYNDFWHGFRIVGFCLGFINSCINPIALYCISGTFRKHYNRYLFCCCCKGAKHERRDTTTSTSLPSVRTRLSRYRSSTLRPLENMTITSLLQDRPCHTPPDKRASPSAQPVAAAATTGPPPSCGREGN